MRTLTTTTMRIILVSGLCCLAATTRASTPFDLAQFKGRVIYLDFWASWCGPCRKSFPWMEALKNAYESQGLTVIAVDLDSDHGDAERFLEQFRPDFDIRFDPKGLLAEKFNVIGMPTSVLIDRHGVALQTHRVRAG